MRRLSRFIEFQWKYAHGKYENNISKVHGVEIGCHQNHKFSYASDEGQTLFGKTFSSLLDDASL